MSGECRNFRILVLLFNDRFGSLAVIKDNLSLMSGIGGKADVQSAGNTKC